MISEELTKNLTLKTDSKIVLLIMDGVGDVNTNGKTALEAAETPNLNKLAGKSELGFTLPIDYGITPGSGPAHLSIFGYDPLNYNIGRGVLEALGINMDLSDKDLAVRGNFCTIEGNTVTDRRAGRIPTEKNIEIVKKLSENIKNIDDAEVVIKPGKEHRFVVVFRAEGLSDSLTDADPQKEGREITYTKATNSESEKAASIANKFIDKVIETLKDEKPANGCLLRGMAKIPPIPTMEELFKLKSAAIATYPMYNGLARLVGMEILDAGETIQDEIETLKQNYNNFDFFYLHIKKTDSYGEDGNFDSKAHIIEEVDKVIPDILSLNPDVLAITGDHSTPAAIAGHSWHPNPFLIHSKFIRIADHKAFTEDECRKGHLGTMKAMDGFALMMANALKYNKYGA